MRPPRARPRKAKPQGEAAEGEAADGEAVDGEAAEGDTEPASVPAVGSETAEEILAAIEGDGTLTAIITTNMGTFTCELFEEKVPNTVANFAGLAMGLKSYTDGETNAAARGHFYDGLIFHRVIPRFMIQGGDPTGTGSGGPAIASPTSSTRRCATTAARCSRWRTRARTRTAASSS